MTDLSAFPIPQDLGSPGETDAALERLSRGEMPEPPEAGPNLVQLMRNPNGSRGDCQAEVRELNGYDEEAIARFQASSENTNIPATLNRVAELATTSIDGTKPTITDIEALMVGDRNLLVMAIRRLTYGPTISGSVQCGACLESNDVILDPWVDLEYVPFDGEFFHEVELRHGSRATVRRMLAGDQSAAFGTGMNLAERNSALLERMVMDIDRQNIHAMASTAAVATRSLGLVDRRTLLESMVDQPGYQFGKEVEGHCASCSVKLELRLEVADLLQS